MAERTELGSQGPDAEATSNVPQASDPSSVGRRDFLKGTVAVGVGAGLAATSEAAQVMVAKSVANPKTMFHLVITSARRSTKTKATIQKLLGCSCRCPANTVKTRLASKLVLAGRYTKNLVAPLRSITKLVAGMGLVSKFVPMARSIWIRLLSKR